MAAAKPKPVEDEGKLETVVREEVNLAESNRGVWLLKIPRFVADAWRFAKDDEVLGEITLHPPAQGGTGRQLHMHLDPDARCRKEASEDYKKTVELEKTGVGPRVLERRLLGKRERGGSLGKAAKRKKLADPAEAPTEYKIRAEKTEDKKINVIGHIDDYQKMQWVGYVEYKCDTQPVRDAQYSQVCKTRAERSREKFRATKYAADDEIDRDALMQAPVTNREKSAHSSTRRERMLRPELEARIFEAFQEREYWTSKDLAAKLDQAASWVREVLSDLCIYNKKAPFKNTYQLKPEYKVQMDVEEAGAKME